MLGKIFLVGLVGAAAYGASRMMKVPADAVANDGSTAADDAPEDVGPSDVDSRDRTPASDTEDSATAG